MDEDAVIARVRAGEADAFAALVQGYERAVFAIVRSHGLGSEAEDVAQDVFLSAYRALPRYDRRPGGFAPWLYAIARNRCRDVLRRLRPLPAAPRQPSVALEHPDGEVPRWLDEALLALPVERRVAFLLVEVHGLSQAEAAEIEDVAVGTIKSRLHRARAALRDCLRAEREAGR